MFDAIKELVAHLKEGHIALGVILSGLIAIVPALGIDPEQAQVVMDAVLTSGEDGITALQGLLAFFVSANKLVGILGTWAVVLKARKNR